MDQVSLDGRDGGPSPLYITAPHLTDVKKTRNIRTHLHYHRNIHA